MNSKLPQVGVLFPLPAVKFDHPMKKNQKIHNINDLSPEILLHIISFLPSIDAIRTSAVARSWRNLWRSILTLYFDVENFSCENPQKSKSTIEVLKLFTDFISKRIAFYIDHLKHLDLHKFKLRCGNDEYTHDNLNSWFRYVIEAKVAELDLDFSHHRYSTLPSVFEFNSTLFFDLIKSSVEVLKLRGVYFTFPKGLCFRLESIREVVFERFESTDKEIADFTTSCVCIERLCLAEGLGLKNLKIESQNLKHLKLKCFNVASQDEEFSVEICGPSLVSLDLFCVHANVFTLKSSLSLVEAKVEGFECFSMSGWMYWTNVVTCLIGVERLTIQNMWPYRHRVLHPAGNKVSSETFVFHNLTHLELWTEFSRNNILGLENLLRQCPQLATMILACTSNAYGYSSHLNCDYDPKDMSDIIFQVPYLRRVTMKDFKDTKNAMYVVNLLKKHGVVLEKIVAYPRKVDGKPSSLPYVL